METQLPNIPIKIVRLGEKLKLVCGDYTLVLREIPGKPQYYPLLLLDKFISEVTTIMLRKEIDKQQSKKDVSKLLKIDDADITDRIVENIHRDLFGRAS